jgi:hypothetical protein
MDADMGAYHNWLNQQRSLGAEKSWFLVWFEGRHAAIAISPSIPRQTKSESELTSPSGSAGCCDLTSDGLARFDGTIFSVVPKPYFSNFSAFFS